MAVAPRAALPRPALRRTRSSSASRAARASAPRRAARTSASSPPRTGWNLYVGGNGGFTPRHAVLLAEDLDDETAGARHRPLPDVLRPHRRPPAAHRAVARGASRAASTRSARSSSTTASASPPTSTRRWPRTSTPTRTSGPRPSTTRRSCASSRRSSTRPTTADPTLAYVAERGQRRPATAAERAARTLRSRPHRRHHPGGSLMTAVADRAHPRRRLRDRRPHARARRRRPRRRRAGRPLPARRRPRVRGAEPRPVLRRVRDLARHHRLARRCADRRLAHVQAGLLARARALPGHRWTRTPLPGRGPDLAVYAVSVDDGRVTMDLTAARDDARRPRPHRTARRHRRRRRRRHAPGSALPRRRRARARRRPEPVRRRAADGQPRRRRALARGVVEARPRRRLARPRRDGRPRAQRRGRGAGAEQRRTWCVNAADGARRHRPAGRASTHGDLTVGVVSTGRPRPAPGRGGARRPRGARRVAGRSTCGAGASGAAGSCSSAAARATRAWSRSPGSRPSPTPTSSSPTGSAPPALIDRLPADVEVINVGKSPTNHPVPQDEINASSSTARCGG